MRVQFWSGQRRGRFGVRLAQHGHEVSLYATPEFGDNVVAGGPGRRHHRERALQGFAPVRYSGHDVGEAWPVPSSCWSWVLRTARSRWPRSPGPI